MFDITMMDRVVMNIIETCPKMSIRTHIAVNFPTAVANNTYEIKKKDKLKLEL